MLRTHTCWELTKKDIWKKVTLIWWARHRRDHGWVIFIDLADRYWISQIVFDPNHRQDSYEIADKVRNEYVLQIIWVVRARPEWQENTKINTGEIEILVDEIKVISKSNILPFEIDEHNTNTWEEIRYKYRYLDIRRKPVLETILFRSKFLNWTRKWFYENDFIEVQTPILANSSPEWARDYLVPSRLNPWKFYALPQAPQQYKQLLMVWWIDKYFQIAPCFRDEDPRADRHAWDFYQIDCEMSFVEQDDIFNVVENYIKYIVKILAPNKKILLWKDLQKKLNIWKYYNEWFLRLTYDEAMNFYWTDKPDLRFDMKFVDLTDVFNNSNFWVFKSVVDNNWTIKAIKINKKMSRKEIDDLTKIAQKAGAKWLAYIIYEEEWAKSPILKFFSDNEKKEIQKRLNPKNWDIIFFSADKFEKAVKVLDIVRQTLRDWYNLVDKDELAMVWITDFPMFEKDENTWKIDFSHNPFSAPQWWYEAILNKNDNELLNVKAFQYDLVTNWYEILSWSIRNTDTNVLVEAFKKVGRSEQEVKEKFWAMYEAFQYWAPPHGWFAIWMDRLIMILTDENNIREVYAFPKTWKWIDLMTNSPSEVDEEQLDELSIKIDLD